MKTPQQEPTPVDQHTPGPWTVGGRYGLNRTEINNNPCTKGLATVWTHDRVPSSKHRTTRDNYKESAEGIANARLIAAAPGLLAACELVVARWEKGDLAEAANACSAAIADAQGGAA